MESFSSANYSKWDDDHAWSSQEWKTDTETYERSGRPDETSWRTTREVRPGFSHEETLHDGTAQSVVNEVIPRARSGRPDVVHDNLSHEQTMLNEANMDFRTPGLPHSVVKHAQSTSVRELIQKSENHPDRHALQQDLRQNQAYNPFCPESKKMIQEVGNVELFELLETDLKTQCKASLSYWNVGIVYCTCGHFLQKETAVNRKFVKYTMDLLSLPEYVIKKGRPHGHRYGKKPGDKEHYLANQLKKKSKKKKFQGIHDRFPSQNQTFR